MKLKFYVYCPDDKKVINDIIGAAARFGAGIYGNYSQVAFFTKGVGNWKTESGAKPFLGKIGKVTRAPVVRIEMTCQKESAKEIEQAIKKIHPWEQVDNEFVSLENI